jgi:hypothetical protein
MGFGAAQKKERDAAQTAITRNPGRRLCSTGVQAMIVRLVADEVSDSRLSLVGFEAAGY